MKKADVQFTKSYFSVGISHNGYHIIYVPLELDDPYMKKTRDVLDNHMITYKTLKGAVNFLVEKQGAIVVG